METRNASVIPPRWIYICVGIALVIVLTFHFAALYCGILNPVYSVLQLVLAVMTGLLISCAAWTEGYNAGRHNALKWMHQNIPPGTIIPNLTHPQREPPSPTE